MNKVKFLSVFSVGLLVINLALIWFVVSQKKHEDRHPEPKYFIIEKLKFDEKQIADYQKLIDWHKGKIRPLRHEMMDLKNQLFSGLQQGNNSAKKDSLIAEIANIETEIEQVHYKHFEDIKKLCKPEQQANYDELCLAIAKLFSNQKPPRNEKH